MKFKSRLMTAQDIVRALKRISHQITERNDGVKDVVVLGIAKGGIPLAKQIAANLREIEGTDVPFGILDISRHRDDLALREENGVPETSLTSLPCDISGKNVVLVDDVLYTGRTARAAMDALSDHGRAATIQLAVLIDRGHRELPIRADYVGKNVPSSHTETIRVDLDEESRLPAVDIYDL